jgi:hypothetical protein
MWIIGVALVGIMVWSLGMRTGSSPSTSAGNDGSGASTSGNGSGVTGASSDGPPSTSASPSYPEMSLTGKECGRTGDGPYAAAAAANDHTSCPFALNVRDQYVGSGGNGSAVSITAHSPVTNKDYTMQCSGSQPVTCSGGNDAVVYLYGGSATFSG